MRVFSKRKGREAFQEPQDKLSRHDVEEFGRAKKEFIVCPEGNEVYYRKCWHHSFNDLKRISEEKNLIFKLCPFHQMVKNGQYEGEVIVERVPERMEHDLIQLIKNRGEYRYQRDPMDRIIKIESGKNTIRVTTSENQLAQEIAAGILSRFKKAKKYVNRAKKPSDVVRIKILFSFAKASDGWLRKNSARIPRA